jgi:aerobic carbon-monoxide dehydrogenase large subunit
MDINVQDNVTKFGVGQPVTRREDPILLQGRGRYNDDINLPGQLYGYFLRSPYAHGILRGIDASAALEVPGVRRVLTVADLDANGIGPMPVFGQGVNPDGTPSARPPMAALVRDKVRYVGEAVALVVADTLMAARDGAEAIVLDVDMLPALTSGRAALAEDAPLIYDTVPGNVVQHYHYGDAEAVSAAFAQAAHVTKLDVTNNRVVVAQMEPRSAIGEYIADGDRYTLHTSSQGVMLVRNMLLNTMGVKADRLRVLTGNVGGSFGMKYPPYPEYPCLLLASKLLGAPVKWTDDRSQSFVADSHGRNHETVAELALDAEGRFLAVRLSVIGDIGANVTNATMVPPTLNAARNTLSVYRTPLIEVNSVCVFTNTTPVGAYRGAGRPEGNYYMERLIDTAAHEMGIDRIELRRRNHIQPDQMPYTNNAEVVYDTGEFPALLDQALTLADWDGFPSRRAESARRGKLRGRGVGQFLEVTAGGTPEMGGLRFEDDGTVTIITGTLDYGQGHITPFAQVLVDNLGIPMDKIRLLQGDSDQLIAGGGSGGSRSGMASGQAIIAASGLCIDAGKQIAAHVLEASVADIEFDAGRFSIAGTDRGIDILDLAAKLREGIALPEGMPATLDIKTTAAYDAPALPNGCHVVEVEVDEETGVVSIPRYSFVNDFGTLINPLIVAGQAHGGVVQGVGQALFESVVYDESGQLSTGSFMDYALPRAEDVPSFTFDYHPVPAKTNLLGAKGCGEAGCAGSLPAVMNALVDALRPLGIEHINMPATPLKVWEAIQRAKQAQAA